MAKKPIKARFRPIHDTSLTEGVIQEMARYDGGYTEIKRGAIAGHIGEEPEGVCYEWVEVSGQNVNLQRWLSFGGRMESLETI